jgi:hypothetical protein
MSSSWYIKDKGAQLFSGLENTQNSDLESVFREAALSADNGYNIVANRNGVSDISERVIIQSSTISKHGEKTILFAKGTLRIGDIVNYDNLKYLISLWVNTDISVNDSAPMHLCNALITYVNVAKGFLVQEDALGRPINNDTETDVTTPCVFDTARYYADEGKVINLEKGVVECWVQHNDDLMDSINKEVKIHDKTYTIDGISRDTIVVDGVNYYGVLKLRLRVKE